MNGTTAFSSAMCPSKSRGDGDAIVVCRVTCLAISALLFAAACSSPPPRQASIADAKPEARVARVAEVAQVAEVPPPPPPPPVCDEAHVAACQDACDRGSRTDCTILGLMRLRGVGITPNDALAVELFDKACAAGDAAACRLFGSLVEAGIPKPPPDLAMALRAFTRGCAKGDALACSSLDRLDPSHAPASLPALGCSDPVEGVWIGETYIPRQGEWYLFEVTVRRSVPTTALTGEMLVHYWNSGQHEPYPPRCNQTNPETFARMPLTGEATESGVRFVGGAAVVTPICAHNNVYNPDRFVGSIAAGLGHFTWLDDLRNDFKESIVFRRERCLAPPRP